MSIRFGLAGAASLLLCAGTGFSQVPLVQPGAPGQPTKTLPGPVVGTAQREPTKADFDFMTGMIMHHNQAVVMTAMISSHSSNPSLLELGQRIGISQSDEMKFMKRWLVAHGKPVTEPIAEMDHMAGMENMAGMQGMDMSDMAPMPGMLTPKQMVALRNAKGPEFDRLFLTGMIQHHTGALTMVKELFDTPSAGQDPRLFDFTADVDVTQRGEIAAMQGMLAKEKQ